MLRLVPSLGVGLLKFIHRSCRQYTINQHYEKQLFELGHPILLTTWHFAFPATLYLYSEYLRKMRDLRVTVMVSASKDGEFVARALTSLGFTVIRGSSHRKGVEALRKMIRMVRLGYHVGLMADGSKGPARRAQRGVVLVARHTGSPILPIIIAGKPRITFPSWDRTRLTLPFGKLVAVYGTPLFVDKKASKEEIDRITMQVGKELNRLTEVAETFLSGKESNF